MSILSGLTFLAILVFVVVLCHKRGVNLNVGERPENPYSRR